MFLITNSNIGLNAGNTSLVFRRSKSLFESKNIYTYFISYKSKHSVKPTSNNFSTIFPVDSKKNLKDLIAENKPDYILIYGDKIQLLVPFLKKVIRSTRIQCEILLDVQSSIEEKKEYAPTLIRRFLYPIYKILFISTLKKINGAFVVSDELVENCNKKVYRESIQYYKVRCGVSELIGNDELIRNRARFRKDYHLEDKIVFCFSGFRFGWQKIDETIEEFQYYDRQIENCFFCFFCDSDKDFEDKLSMCFPKNNYLVKLLNSSEYFSSLCGCDVGYLLRDYNETNRVAFPNKFSDYLNAGLLVAINSSLAEPFRLIKTFNVPFLNTNPSSDLEKNLFTIGWRETHYNDYVLKTRNLIKEELLYDKQIEKLKL